MSDPYYNPTLPPHVPEAVVHDFNVFNPIHDGLDPYESIMQLREIGLPDIFWTRNNGGHWIALGSDAIFDAARDAVTFSTKRMLVPDEQNFETAYFVPNMADPPEHGQYRAIVNPLFAPKKIEAIREKTRQLTGELIERFRADGHCEFMADFATEMPVIVYLQLLDLPLEHRAGLVKMASDIVSPPSKDGVQRDDSVKLMFDYLRPILLERRQNPGNDVLSQIAIAKRNGKPLETEEMVGLAANVLQGGLDTVTAVLGSFARYLADHPEARRRLRDDPTKIPAAVEELVRRYPPTTHGRLVSKDIVFHGVDMRKDDHLVWISSMANLDERQCPHAMNVDLDRARTVNFSFGTGAHFCLGIFLAKMELGVFIEEWLRLIPDFRIKPGTELQFRCGLGTAYYELPLEWDVP